MFSAREETSDSTISAFSQPTQSASTDSHPPHQYTLLAYLPWIAFALLFTGVAAVLLFRRRKRLAEPKMRQVRYSHLYGDEEFRASSETLLNPGWEKRSSLISAPALAHSIRKQCAPGQEDAVFRTTRDQRRAFHSAGLEGGRELVGEE
ncbi:hypothetical protein C8R43DRAFT_952435 [Mycena crocata]|nr:hypothetical protein C8R43DRAFT_952435 [Mycena crocata]